MHINIENKVTETKNFAQMFCELCRCAIQPLLLPRKSGPSHNFCLYNNYVKSKRLYSLRKQYYTLCHFPTCRLIVMYFTTPHSSSTSHFSHGIIFKYAMMLNRPYSKLKARMLKQKRQSLVSNFLAMDFATQKPSTILLPH